MSERDNHPVPPERPRRRRGPRTRDQGPSREERALQAARRRANAKVSFYIHGLSFAAVVAMLFVVAGPRAATIVAMSWGIGLALHYFVVMVAPDLRRKFVNEEIGREIERGVHRERRAVESRTARSLEDLSASIAHEIRNPISAAKSLVQQMGEDPVSVENMEYAKVALEELDRVERSISHLLRYARDTDLRTEPFHIADVVASALETFRDRLVSMQVDLRTEVDSDAVLQGDPEKVRRVVINLIANALDAMAEAGTPSPALDVGVGENLAGSEVWVRVRDNGPGIEPERLSNIFSPFYTTKDAGTGLGLALSKKVVDAHGGTLEANSALGEGSEFVLTLPKHAENGGGAR